MMGECCISFPGPVSKKTMSYLIIDYLKYILYYRGQFPLPLDQLKEEKEKLIKRQSPPVIDGHQIYCDDQDRQVSAVVTTKSVLNSRSQQKFFESISKFDDFFSELTRILETKDVSEIVLNLGTNMMNPKELYRIALPTVCSEEECTYDYASAQKCKVHFFQNIVTSDIWADLNSDSLLPVSVLLLLKEGNSLDQHMELKRFYAPPKHCKHRTLRFTESCCHLDSSSEECESTSAVNNSTSGLWVKLKPDLKGFKSYSES